MLTEKLSAVYPKIKTFVEEELYLIESTLLKQSFAESVPLLEEKREKVRKMGLFTPHLSEHHGGAGFNLVELAQIGELLGSSLVGHYVFNCHAPDAGNMELLAGYGSDELKERYLKPLVEGNIRSCFSMTEPEYAGSNPVKLGTTAVLEGDEYVVNGHKWFTSSADGASFSIVMAVTNPDAPPYMRASMIVVPTDTKGFELVRNIPVMGDEGDGWMSHAEIRYNNCRVPKHHLIGAAGAGFMLAQERLGPGRIHHCMRWIGICERAFDLMCRRAATRKIGRDVFLGEKQMIQAWIAESRADIDAARLMVLNTAQKMDELGVKAVRTEVSTIKFFVANILHKVLDRAIQVHGALGITDDLVLSFWYRHERGARIYDGPDEVHKASLARRILKKYGLHIKNN